MFLFVLSAYGSVSVLCFFIKKENIWKEHISILHINIKAVFVHKMHWLDNCPLLSKM